MPEKISLRGAPATMLATLYGKALDSRSPDSILHDGAADRAVQRIDHDFRSTGMTPTSAAGVALRAKQLADWTREFFGTSPRGDGAAPGLRSRHPRSGWRRSMRACDGSISTIQS